MAVDPISTASRLLPTSLPSLPTTDHAAPASAAGGFGDMVVGAMENLDALHGTADSLAIQAATGDLADVHEYTIAATQAELATQLTVAVRDKAVEAFNDIMRMQF
jgi:flagellar hook-basal body complex protein FliE